MLINVFNMRMVTKYIISFIHDIKTFYLIDRYSNYVLSAV